MRRSPASVALFIISLVALGACRSAPAAPPQVLRLATTTSTADSGLLDALLPDFEQKHHARVDVVAVGTGQALEIGSKGDADLVLVHARSREEQFVAAGDGLSREDVMYNDFVIVGPPGDPAGVRGLAMAKDAFTQIAAHGAPFVSRGDDSGTHTKEKSLWAAAGVDPAAGAGWYFAIGQGMGETLLFATEQQAYTLADRGTWLAQQSNLPGLELLVGGQTISDNEDPSLLNPYGVIVVNPERHPGVNAALAQQFVTWITSLEVQARIARFGVDRFSQPLFYPSSAAWKAANP